MAAIVSSRRPEAGAAAISSFLQDVVGREESLSPSCGRLREIHARIGKEVQDAKVGWKALPETRRDEMADI